MSTKKTILFVSGCCTKTAPSLEKFLKDLYLGTEKKNNGVVLTFIHAGAKPHEIAEKVKAKKPAFLVFNENTNVEVIPLIQSAVKKRVSELSMVHIGGNPDITPEGILCMKDHAKFKQVFAA